MSERRCAAIQGHSLRSKSAFRLYQFNRPVFAKLAAQCATSSSSTSSLYGRSTSNAADGRTPQQQQHRHSAIGFRELSEAEMRELRESIFAE